MKRVLLSSFVALLLLSQSAVIAAALSLNTIGVSTVGGTSIASWSYQGSNPTFVGMADPSASVTISIGGTTNTVTADGTGSWTYVPTTLTSSGAYPITLTSGSESMTFTLNLTSVSGSVTSTASSSVSTTSGELVLPEELPQTGMAQETMLLLGGGLGLVMMGVLFYWKVVPKLLFEESQADESQKEHFE